MGTTAHVIGDGAPDGWFDAVAERLARLESRWSRFVPASDVCRANANAGHATVVAPETAALVAAAVGWSQATGGLFEPAVLEALVAAGYDRSFELGLGGGSLAGRPAGRAPHVDLDASTITVHPGAAIDLGGIGKGAAVDLVVGELGPEVTSGCINLGGDLRAWGAGPWSVAVDVPGRADLVVGIESGAIATSSIERRRWRTDDGDAHHLIDPRTGRPAVTDLGAVTVVEHTAAAAEVRAKAALVAGSTGAELVLDGSPALLRTTHGDVLAVNGMERYLA